MVNDIGQKIVLVFFVFVFCVSLGLNLWQSTQLNMIIVAYNKEQSDARVLDFANMFVKNILMADKDIDFETRLSLETAVRALNDQDIFGQWQKFTKCSTKEEASTEAKMLLDLLIRKIRS